jgi:thymidylate synthase ThyX
MQVTGISITPPAEAAGNPSLTPELLASVLARYSRSNEGLPAILSKVDLGDPVKSIDRILKFVDYGHASIGGLTGGIAIALDGVSMWLAYKLFEISPMSDGQESSTRYITLGRSALPPGGHVGIPDDLEPEWHACMEACFDAYASIYDRLDAAAAMDPSVVRAPDGAKPSVLERLRKNYALDRARYLIPFAAKTNVAIVQSARMWAQTVRHLASHPQLEAKRCADLLRTELMKYAPRLMRHSGPEASYERRVAEELQLSLKWASETLSAGSIADEVWLETDASIAPFLRVPGSVGEAFSGRANRYGHCGLSGRRTRVTVAWNNMAIAELRDLNRHRTGHRWSPLIQAGVYLPVEVDRSLVQPVIDRQTKLLGELLSRKSPAYPYALLLGSQTPFEHTMLADKFVYEAELRTGMGAHFRYAEHLSAALRLFHKNHPESRIHVVEGTAEPE